ncbi:uncharacterized protein K441DRAFT_587450, partial [Cenococcum geophilum 1.58]
NIFLDKNLNIKVGDFASSFLDGGPLLVKSNSQLLISRIIIIGIGRYFRP